MKYLEFITEKIEIYYTVGAIKNYDKDVKAGICYKAEGGTVFRNFKDALKSSKTVSINGRHVEGKVYKIKGKYQNDVINPELDISELKKKKKVYFI